MPQNGLKPGCAGRARDKTSLGRTNVVAWADQCQHWSAQAENKMLADFPTFVKVGFSCFYYVLPTPAGN